MNSGAAAPLLAAQGPFLASVATYYSEKIQQYGAVPLGVDWSCVPTQEMRFVQLLKLCDFSSDFSLNDVGCGYGALLQYMNRRRLRSRVDYLGTDLSQDMIAAATERWRSQRLAEFSVACNTPRVADYSVASGTFNVKLQASDEAWELLVGDSLECLHRMSRRGFAVNFLCPPMRAESRIPELYYAESERWASHCEERFGVDVEVLSGYGLKEYTLLVRRRTG